MQHKYDDPFGPVTSGALKIESVMRRVDICFQKNLQDFVLGVYDEEEEEGGDGEDVLDIERRRF